MGVTQNPQGWTDVTPAADTKIAYVDATAGNDGTAVFYDWDDPAVGADPYNPVGPINAYQTLAAAIANLRYDMADWLLLKRGETWTDEWFDFSASNSIRGRSRNEPTYIGSYGDTSVERPLVKPNGTHGIDGTGVNGFFVVQSVYFYSYTRNPDDPANAGLRPDEIDTTGSPGIEMAREVNETERADFILIEDCRVSYFNTAISIYAKDAGAPNPTDNTIRRCTIEHSYRSDGGNSHGTWVSAIEDLLVEDCYFSNCGWYGKTEADRSNSPIPGAEASGFSQSNYWTAYCPFFNGTPNTADNRGKFRFLNNIVMESSAAGVQLRAGGTITGNLSWRDPWPFLNGHPSQQYDSAWPGGVYGIMDGNVSDECIDVKIGDFGGGLLRVRNSREMTINQNLCIRKQVNVNADFAISSNSNAGPTTIQQINGNVFNNTFKGAPSPDGTGPDPIYLSVEDNEWWNASGVPYPVTGTNRNGESKTYTDDTRDVRSYATRVLGLGGVDDMWTNRLAMHRGNWDAKFLAYEITGWIKEGFDVSQLGPAAPTNLQVEVSS